MNNDYTHASILIDKSGSMSGSEADVIGGINKFIEEQRKVPGKLTVTLVQFDSLYEKAYEFVDINEVELLNENSYKPRGSTCLRDSAGRLINETGARLAAMPEAVRPGKVIFLVFTDGGENSSIEWSKERLDALVKQQTEQYKWDFVFLGADLSQAEAINSYSNLVTGSAGSASTSKRNLGKAYNMVSSKFTSYRSAVGGGGMGSAASESLSFSDAEIKELNTGAGDAVDLTGKTGAGSCCSAAGGCGK